MPSTPQSYMDIQGEVQIQLFLGKYCWMKSKFRPSFIECVIVCFSEGMPQMDNQQKTMMWTNNYMDSGIQSGATTQVLSSLSLAIRVRYLFAKRLIFRLRP